MLVLSRRPGESLYIGNKIKVKILDSKGNQVRIGIEAPRELPVYREELFLQIQEENREAAEAALSSELGLDSLSDAWLQKGVSKKNVSKDPVGSGLKETGKAEPDKDLKIVVRRAKKKS